MANLSRLAFRSFNIKNYINYLLININSRIYQGCGAATKKLGAVSAPAPPS